MVKKIGSNERFVRWQNVLREYITFVNNVLLTISVGILGFAFSILDNPDFNPKCSQKVFFTLSLITLLICILFGIITCISRLYDFRTTLKKIRNELKLENFEKEKNKMEIYKKTTWCFFNIQLFTFLFSTSSLTISFILKYYDKLF